MQTITQKPSVYSEYLAEHDPRYITYAWEQLSNASGERFIYAIGRKTGKHYLVHEDRVKRETGDKFDACYIRHLQNLLAAYDNLPVKERKPIMQCMLSRELRELQGMK